MIPEGLPFTVCWLRLGKDEYPVLDYLIGLEQTDYPCFAALIDALGKLGDSRFLREPLVKALKGEAVKGIFELRVLAGNNRHFARLPLIYCPEHRQELILLFGETKKGAHPPPQFIKRAITYRNKLKSNEATHEEIDTSIFNQ